MKKRLLELITCFLFILTLASCGKKNIKYLQKTNDNVCYVYQRDDDKNIVEFYKDGTTNTILRWYIENDEFIIKQYVDIYHFEIQSNGDIQAKMGDKVHFTFVFIEIKKLN